ncbi:hypothetical protein PENSPDRAFT_759101 [Peniophora sp. CONT]|nr:hypothetical protein PENSPDRAFT_759101 [Peniophora sp. CONT]
MGLAVTFMFGFTTYYIAMSLRGLWAKFNQLRTTSQGHLATELITIYDIGLNDNNFTERGQILAFAANAIIGDGIILWRAIVISGIFKRIKYTMWGVSGVLLAASLGIWLFIGITETTGAILIGSEALSLAISTFATLFIMWKAWQRRRMIMKRVKIVRQRSTRDALENVFAILTESGVLYTMLWIAYIIATLKQSADTEFSQDMTIIMVVVTPLYPTVIVILVAMHITPLSDQLTSVVQLTMVDPEHGELLPQSEPETPIDMELSQVPSGDLDPGMFDRV